MLPYFKTTFTGGLHSYNRLATIFKYYTERLDLFFKHKPPEQEQLTFKNITVREIVSETNDLE